MKTKPADVLYCGVRKKKIESAQPELDPVVLKHLNNFIKRRYGIHLRKDILGEPAPWTHDKVLQEYRFTNVRREHDRETKWLLEHIVHSSISYEDKLLNIILFRLFNKHETAELLGLPIEFSKNPDWYPEDYREVFAEAKAEDPHRVFFTGAFITGGLKTNCKGYIPKGTKDEVNLRMLYYIKFLIEHNFVEGIKFAKTQEGVMSLITHYDGVGTFLGYQIFVDFTYIPEFPFSENEFVVSGPGCHRGLELLFRNKDGMNDAECLFWLRNNIDKVFREQVDPNWDTKRLFWDLPEEDRYMNVMSLENCFCELSKYVRAKRGTGRPRKKYKQTKDNTND